MTMVTSSCGNVRCAKVNCATCERSVLVRYKKEDNFEWDNSPITSSGDVLKDTVGVFDMLADILKAINEQPERFTR